jgi:RNA polymerase sigma-70 factor, ECF subfamily
MSAVTLSDVTTGALAQDLDRIFRDHYQLVYRTAYGVTGSAEDAEDILQTIFVRLLQRESLPDLERNPRAYLYRAAVNLSLNVVRLRKRTVPVQDPEHFEAPAETNESDVLEELHRRLYRAIAELDPESSQMVVLRYVHNYSDAEIARMLGESRGKVAVRLFRARARLKQLIRAYEGEGQ